MASKERMYHLDFAKLCLTFVVILSHSIKVVNDDWLGVGVRSIHWLSYVSQWFGTFHVQAFTTISGYIFSYLYLEQEKYRDTKEFFVNKFRRLIIPYLFVSIIWIIPINKYIFDIDVVGVFHSFVLMENPSQLWYVVMLFGVFAIARLLGKYPLRNPIAFLTIITATYFLGVVFERMIPNYFQIWSVMRYLMYFYLGFYLRRFHSIGKYIEQRLYLVVLLEVLLYGTYLYIGNIGAVGMIYTLIRVLFELLLGICGSLLAFYCFGKLGLGCQNWGVIRFLERLSMTIFLIHNQFNFLSMKILHLYVSDVMLLITICFICTSALSIILSSILHHYKITRFLIGEE